MFNLIDNESKTLWSRWEYFARTQPMKDAVIHWSATGRNYRWSYGQLLKSANKYSERLKQLGVKKGDVCALIIRHNPQFYPLYLGIVGIGALPAVLAYPNPRLHHEKFQQGLIGMSERSGLNWIFAERELERIIKPLIVYRGKVNSGLFFPLEWELKENINAKELEELEEIRNSTNENDPVLLQHSSGTTGLQKPIVLTHKAVLDHVNNYGKAIQLSDNDIAASWLPLYHDMGLIAAFHLPLASGITTIQIDPFEWVLAPSILLDVISKEKATLTWLPNFAYNLMADKIKEDELEKVSLGSLRMVVNCSEKIRADSHEKFHKKFSNYGLNENALTTMYAMAETTLAITQSEPEKRATEIMVDRNELSRGFVEITENEKKSIGVSSGKPINDCEIKIVNDRREEVSEDRVREIAVKSVSMFQGYRNYPGKTAEVLDDKGWFYTGDLGFIYKDELYVIGRIKDIIIVAGNNIYPEDIEDAVGKIENVIPGRVVAFGEEDEELGTEQISVIAETKFDNEIELRKLSMDIVKAGMSIDVNIQNVYLVPPRWLIKSSSGKPSRKTNKQRIMDNIDRNVWSNR
ncbi:MAG: fatty acyl-AMP ligase [Chlorobi bacterium]|nr:fatty acyl-AMP ligase [Chlorobiota bacterium]